MSLASGHWVDKEIAGVPPSPRWVHSACRCLCNAIRRKKIKNKHYNFNLQIWPCDDCSRKYRFLVWRSIQRDHRGVWIQETAENICSYFIKIIDSNIVPVQLFFILRMILQYIWMTFTWLQVPLVKYFAVNT